MLEKITTLHLWKKLLRRVPRPGKVSPSTRGTKRKLKRISIALTLALLSLWGMWHVNNEWGLERGFTISHRPSAVSGRLPWLTLRLTSATNVRALLAAEKQSIVVADHGTYYPLSTDSLVTSQAVKLTAADGATYDWFGYSVSVSGDILVVGAHQASVGGNWKQGAAYVFMRNQGGADAWGQVTKLTSSDGAADDGFGYSVSVSGDTLVIGAHGAAVDSHGAQGAAYAFYRNRGGADAWGQVAKLTSPDGAGLDRFGWSVSISGDTVAFGAPYADVSGNSAQGASYLFTHNQNGADAWSTPSDGR